MAGAESTPDALDVARFWSKVEVTRKEGACWLWRGIAPEQYGELKWLGRSREAHRVAYEIVHGPIPDGMVVRHDCDTPACCNPLHLRTGTHADNVRDRVLRRRGAIGERHPRAKLTEAQVLDIATKARPAPWYAAHYGCSEDNIHAIWERKSWRHLWRSPPA
jgi:hypothetical protein